MGYMEYYARSSYIQQVRLGLIYPNKEKEKKARSLSNRQEQEGLEISYNLQSRSSR